MLSTFTGMSHFVLELFFKTFLTFTSKVTYAHLVKKVTIRLETLIRMGYLRGVLTCILTKCVLF